MKQMRWNRDSLVYGWPDLLAGQELTTRLSVCLAVRPLVASVSRTLLIVKWMG